VTAQSASSAGTAQRADSARTAQSADSARTAQSADDAGKLGGMTLDQILAGQRQAVFTPGMEMTLAPWTCAFILSSGGALSASDAGKVIAMWITNAEGKAVPSLNNASAFIPGTVALTSQGGAIAFGQVCNLGSRPDLLPSGWKVMTRFL